MENQRHCPNCNGIISSDALYCSYCGAAIDPSSFRPSRQIPQETTSSFKPVPPASEPAFKSIELTPEPIQHMNVIDRITGVVIHPNGTFRYLAQQPDIRGSVVIFLGGLLLSLLSVMILLPKIQLSGDFSSLFSGIDLAGLDPTEIMNMIQGMLPSMILFGTVFGGLIMFGVITVVYWALAKIFGGTGNLRNTLVVTGFSSVPSLFSGAYRILLAMISPPLVIDISTLLSNNTSLQGLFGVNPIVDLLVTGLFGLWQGLLVGYGLRHVHRLELRNAMVIGIGLWTLGMVINLSPFILSLIG